MERQENGTERLDRLREEARHLGITGRMTADDFEAAIAQAMTGDSNIGEPVKADDVFGSAAKAVITPEEAEKIEVRLKFEDETREKFRRERQNKIDRATILAEAEVLKIKIDLPEIPTELELAKARVRLGIQKTIPKPSPETVAIESSKRGYYIFTNREQDNASHTVNPGGKYRIHLIPDQVHVLSEHHIKLFRKNAIVPIYERVAVPGDPVEGQMKEMCQRTGGRQRFAFEHLGEAPQNAAFGLVTNTKVLDGLKQEQLS